MYFKKKKIRITRSGMLLSIGIIIILFKKFKALANLYSITNEKNLNKIAASKFWSERMFYQHAQQSLIIP